MNVACYIQKIMPDGAMNITIIAKNMKIFQIILTKILSNKQHIELLIMIIINNN